MISFGSFDVSQTEVLIAFVGFVIVGGLGVVVRTLNNQKSELLNSKLEEIEELKEANSNQQETISSLHVKVAELNKDLSKYEETLHVNTSLQEELTKEKIKSATSQEALKAQQENNEKLKSDLEEQSKKLELKLNQIMQQNLDAKLKKFDDTSIKSLDGLLKPFKEDLHRFKKQVEENKESDIERFAKMSKQIEEVTKMSLNIGQEAKNLTNALKGNKQAQGSWGEMILDSVLECSGLRVGTHYSNQKSYKDEDGKTKRPDVVVKLPQERYMIIDSKVSLVDYDSYIKAVNEVDKTILSKAIVKAFKNHIDTLASKDYTKFDVGSLQYVFMFVPVEGAFAVAINEEPSLYEYALNKHIVIANPSTLLVSLRTIYLYWQSELSTTNAVRMFEEAGKLHQKMTGFVEDFVKIGNQLQSVTNTYESSKRKLSEGSGNLMKRVEDLKHLGARTTKSLKDSKLQYDDFDEESVELIEIQGEIE